MPHLQPVIRFAQMAFNRPRIPYSLRAWHMVLFHVGFRIDSSRQRATVKTTGLFGSRAERESSQSVARLEIL